MKYQRGPVSTDKEFNKPTIPVIKMWYADMKLAIERSGYQAYMTGRCLTDVNSTMDVDIVFTGTLKLDTLEQLMITSVVTGFRHNLLIDCRWQDNIDTAEYKDGKITILPTEFIFLNYYEQDNGIGRKTINDYKLNPQFKVVNDNLVSSSFNRVSPRLKKHLEQYIMKHGKLANVLLNTLIKDN